MQNIININEDSKTEPIILYLESLLDATPDTIKEKVTEFNQMIDYCIKNGQQCMYLMMMIFILQVIQI